MQKHTCFRGGGSVSLLIVVLVIATSTGGLLAQRPTGIIVADAPLLLLPEKTRSPLLVLEKGATVQVIRREGDWFNITVQGSQWGDRTGFVEAKYVQLVRAEVVRPVPPPSPTNSPIQQSEGVQPAQVASPAAPAAAPPATAPTGLRPPRPVADVSLKNVHRLFIEPMPGDLDQYINAEITKDLKGRLVVVLDKANADAIMRGVGENRNGVGAAITGRYLRLDDATASITVIDPGETVVLWASEAGDRSLTWGALARGGQRKVADRLVNNLKKALSDAK